MRGSLQWILSWIETVGELSWSSLIDRRRARLTARDWCAHARGQLCAPQACVAPSLI